MTTVDYFIHSAAPSGAELALGRALEVWPDDVSVRVRLGSDGPMVERYRATGHRVLVEPLPEAAGSTRRGSGLIGKARGAAALARYAMALRRSLKADRPSVIVAGSLKSVVYARLASLGLGIQFIWSIHDRLGPEYLGRASPLFAKLLPLMVDGLIVNSRSTLGSVRHSNMPVLICPPGQRIEAVDRMPTVAVHDIAVLGRISPWKGQREAIRAFQVADLPDARLHIIGGALFGEHEYESEIRLLADDRVVFHGHQENPAEILKRCDVLLHSSVIPEPFGSVVLEGMVNGCIVIASKPGGTTEVIDEGRNGYLAPVGDVQAMASTLTEVANMSSAAREAMVSAGRNTVMKYDIVLTTAARAGFIAGPRVDDVILWHEWKDR